jgi:hypothetical protein
MAKPAETRQAFLLSVVEADDAAPGGFAARLCAVLTETPKMAVDIVRLAVGPGPNVEMRGGVFSPETAQRLGLVPDQARFL